MNILSDQEIEEKLQDLDLQWAVIDGVHLERVYDFDNFKQGLQFVEQVGELAEKNNHHPDMKISYNKVTLLLTTHEVDGLTNKDFELAKKIESISKE